MIKRLFHSNLNWIASIIYGSQSKISKIMFPRYFPCFLSEIHMLYFIFCPGHVHNIFAVIYNRINGAYQYLSKTIILILGLISAKTFGSSLPNQTNQSNNSLKLTKKKLQLKGAKEAWPCRAFNRFIFTIPWSFHVQRVVY